MDNIEYLDNFEMALLQKLIGMCRSYDKLNNIFPSSEDIDQYWKGIAPEYLADAVQLVSDYPIVSVAWAAYLGMAVAHGWDSDWSRYSAMKYTDFYGPRGFDDMDEHIVADILNMPLGSSQAAHLEDMMRRCGELTVQLIRQEQIEPQSVMAYHIFVRAARAMYRLGAAMELERMGYKMQPLNIGQGLPS